MAKLYISEYEHMPVLAYGRLPVGVEPAIAVQTPVAIGAEAKSAAFNARTKFVRLHTDAICSVQFGAAPTATTNDARMAANSTEYFGVTAGHKVSVISNT